MFEFGVLGRIDDTDATLAERATTFGPNECWQLLATPWLPVGLLLEKKTIQPSLSLLFAKRCNRIQRHCPPRRAAGSQQRNHYHKCCAHGEHDPTR